MPPFYKFTKWFGSPSVNIHTHSGARQPFAERKFVYNYQSRSTIIFKEGEPKVESVVRKFRTTASDGHKRITDNALVALTLMIAESKTDEMEMMVKVVVNLINGDNM